MAQKCREQADRLDNAVTALSTFAARSMGASWTGSAAESLMRLLDIELHQALDAARTLRTAAGEFDRGAAEVEAYRRAEAAREKREREAAAARARQNGG
jgi:hypothetical protein